MAGQASTRNDAAAWVSLILRLGIAALFCAAAVGKLQGGMTSIRGTVAHFQTAFAETWLPGWMVTAHAWVTVCIEPLIVVWLVTGYRLRIGWIVTCLFVLTLAFGLTVSMNPASAGVYNYLLICCVGLYLSPHDRWNLDRLLSART